MSEELSLEELKKRSNRAFSNMILTIFVLVVMLLVTILYYSFQHNKQSQQFMQDYSQVLNDNAETDIKKYVATTVSHCMENRLYKVSDQNAGFFSFNYVQFQKDMTDVKNQCLTALSDDAELRNSRGGVAINQDSAFENKIRTLLKEQSS